jgi:hypothetical protein
MPTTGSEITEQALRSAFSELLVGPAYKAAPTAAVTLKNLLDLQESIANLAKTVPALQSYSQNLSLASNLRSAESMEISKWTSAAGQMCH